MKLLRIMIFSISFLLTFFLISAAFPVQDKIVTKKILQSITLTPNHMAWDVSDGKTIDHYSIDMATATMTHNGKSKQFDQGEADSVNSVIGSFARYAGESTAWFESEDAKPVNPKVDTMKSVLNRER